MRWILYFALAVSICLAPACSRKPAGEQPKSGNDPLVESRREKDRAFKNDESSPIPPDRRPHFKGLSYYPPNPALKFQVRLNRYDRPEAVQLGTNTGEIRTGLRYGYFEFRVGGDLCRLQAYRMEDSGQGAGPYLFIPFRDATSGAETYGAGRYIDLPENTSGVYDLDFNRAYNPYCAYAKSFSCPLPPPENTLPIAIRAGEKKYPG
jgi:uncharacterized protein (DUF1684 family)